MERRQDNRREERTPVDRNGSARHYRMSQKLLSIGDDYWIENEAGERVFKVDGKELHVRQTLFFEDVAGAELLKIQERLLHVKHTMEIESPDGTHVATVKKAFFTPFREHWTVHRAAGPDLEVQGNIVDHEYAIAAGEHTLATVSKKWFHLRDTYGVEVELGGDDVLLLAIAVVLDQMAHTGR